MMFEQFLKKYIKLSRDLNYYFGIILLCFGTLSIVAYLLFDAFEPSSFLTTFILVSWGFVLLWKSDNELRFKKAQAKIAELEEEIANLQKII